ncbi:hypothetical protein HK100_009716, partial [Physocladia obscura]
TKKYAVKLGDITLATTVCNVSEIFINAVSKFEYTFPVNDKVIITGPLTGSFDESNYESWLDGNKTAVFIGLTSFKTLPVANENQIVETLVALLSDHVYIDKATEMMGYARGCGTKDAFDEIFVMIFKGFDLINAAIPDELLITILANLDPFDLRLSALVCRRWSRVVNDDSCWRLALAGFLGGVLPLRRIARKSWRNEFLRRFRLLREWKSPAKRVVQFDPRLGSISNMLVDFENDRMYAGSLEKGIVAICRPSTGKIERESIYFNTDLEARQISALLIERSRVIAGHLSGQITTVTQFRAKASSSHTINHFFGFHNGPVTALASLINTPTIIVSGGADGCIRIWDTVTLQCLR